MIKEVCSTDLCGHFGNAEGAVLEAFGGAVEATVLTKLAMDLCSRSLAMRRESGDTFAVCGSNPVMPEAHAAIPVPVEIRGAHNAA